MATLPPAQEVLVNLQGNPNALSAYNVCLDFEKYAVALKDNVRSRIIIHARILGYFILHAPSVTVLHEVVKEIHSCGHDYDCLSKLGECFVKYFIRPFKKVKTRTPSSSNQPSRPSFDKDKERMMSITKDPPKDHMDAKKQALIRDGFKCVVTGKYDMKSSRSIGVPEEERVRAGAVYTECVHIAPESLSTCFGGSVIDTKGSPEPEEKDYSASALAILKSFGYDVDRLSGSKVHSLHNVMTMEKDAHDFFDRLEMWFEATNIENRYDIKAIDPAITAHVPKQITFTSSYPDTLPVPSPQLLSLHAMCANVAHLSGAGAYIDEVDQDVDELHVLAYDGGSFDVLNHAIWRSVGFIDVK